MSTHTDLELFTGLLTKFGLTPHYRPAASFTAIQVVLQSGRGGASGDEGEDVEAGFLFDQKENFVEVKLVINWSSAPTTLKISEF